MSQISIVARALRASLAATLAATALLVLAPPTQAKSLLSTKVAASKAVKRTLLRA